LEGSAPAVQPSLYCWRRLKRWEEQGVWDSIFLALLTTLDAQGRAEIALAEETLGLVWVPKHSPGHPKTKPTELVADWGYDSQAFRVYLRRRGIHPCIPERQTSHYPTSVIVVSGTQDMTL
jgi:hypothetical protein